MDQWRRKTLREERSNKNPSFSSTLLDTIYRSIEEEEDMVMYRGDKTTSKKKQSHSFEEEEVENLKRIKNWMEKVKTEEVQIFCNQKQQLGTEEEIDNLVFHSNSSSSDSSFYGFSSSEMESWPSASYRSRRSEKVSRSDDYSSSRKTGNMIHDHDHDKRGSDTTTTTAGASKNSKLSSGSRALKMYRDLKMKNSSNKPPLSPGRRIATFLNSIFTSSRGGGGNGNGNGNNVVKKKVSSQSQATSTAATTTTTTPCSTASSFSRSCLSKTPNSSAGKKIRSVRFYPVSVIVDEDSRPCGHKSLDPDYKVMTTDQQQLLRFHLMEKNRRIEEAAKDMLLFRNYEKKKTSHHHHRLRIRESDDDEDDYDSGSSDSSSDLFELDHLSAGMERRRYREELPVYETTHLRAISNRPIANGYLL